MSKEGCQSSAIPTVLRVVVNNAREALYCLKKPLSREEIHDNAACANM